MVPCVIGCGEVDKGTSSDYTFLIPIFNELREVQELTSAGLSWPETCLLRDEVLIHKRGTTIEYESLESYCIYCMHTLPVRLFSIWA